MTGSLHGNVLLWANMKVVFTKKLFRSWVLVAFSHHSDLIISVAKDGYIKLLDRQLNLKNQLGVVQRFEVRALEVHNHLIGIGGRDKQTTIHNTDGELILVS